MNCILWRLVIKLWKMLIDRNMTKKKPVIKTGAEFPFTRYFYKYASLDPAVEIWSEIETLESEIAKEMKSLKEMP